MRRMERVRISNSFGGFSIYSAGEDGWIVCTLL